MKDSVLWRIPQADACSRGVLSWRDHPGAAQVAQGRRHDALQWRYAT
jgi:hypothetical protein